MNREQLKQNLIDVGLAILIVTLVSACAVESGSKGGGDSQNMSAGASSGVAASTPSSIADERPFKIEPRQLLSDGRPADMVFKHYGVNPTIDTLEENTSTFSIDVDTASYSLTKAYLDRGLLPDPAAVRVEEFVNAMDYGYRAPENELFSLHAEAFPSPHREGFHVLHLGVQGAQAEHVNLKPNNLTFLVDVSGSMAQGERLDMVKEALHSLVRQLNERDTISVVAYSNRADIILPPTAIHQRRKIREAINRLEPDASTNIQAGLELAYRVANDSYRESANNRIILCSDGVANVGQTNPEKIFQRINDAARRGIYLNSVGVGMGNFNDVMLEKLAVEGEGQYAYINSYEEAERFFSEGLLSQLQTLARDVRVQVAFDEAAVASYRLLGYENRALDNSDFNNRHKDAGEVGVGHSVTALYEIKLRPGYGSSNFGTFRLAYKTLDGERLHYINKALPEAVIKTRMADVSSVAQLSLVAAAFAEKLRGAYWSRTYDYALLGEQLRGLKDLPVKDSVEKLARMIHVAEHLDQRSDPFEQRVSLQQMSFDRVPVLQ